MKKFVLASVLALIAHFGFAQSTELPRDGNGSKVVIGFISEKDLATDTAFHWFADNQKDYKPDQNSLQQMRANRDSINIIIFGGTWCGDTKHILPPFYKLADAAGFPQDRITLLGVDREKKTIQHLSELFNITNVPTIIVMKNGKELGRIVEYGRLGMPDVEIGVLLKDAANPTKIY